MTALAPNRVVRDSLLVGVAINTRNSSCYWGTMPRQPAQSNWSGIVTAVPIDRTQYYLIEQAI